MCRRMPTGEDIPARARGILIEFGSRRPQSALFKDSASDMYAPPDEERQFPPKRPWHVHLYPVQKLFASFLVRLL